MQLLLKLEDVVPLIKDNDGIIEVDSYFVTDCRIQDGRVGQAYDISVLEKISGCKIRAKIIILA